MFKYVASKEIKIELEDSQYKQISSVYNINNTLSRNKAFAFDILLNKDVIGFAMLRKYDAGCYFLWDYAIDYKYQNKHYGTNALRELIEFLKKKYKAVEISTTYIWGNEIASHVYQNVGFRITDVIDDGDINEVNMMLKIQ